MYPLVAWSRDEVIERLEKLIDNELYYEAVIASTQTIEQILKRGVEYMMINSRRILVKRDKKTTLVTCEDKNQIKKSLKSLQGLGSLKEAWKILARKLGFTLLPDIFNELMPYGWQYLSQDKNKIENPSENIRLMRGLFPARNYIVHGTIAYRKRDIITLSNKGLVLVEKLLDKDNGLKSYIGWDPQKRMPSFKTQ